MIYIKNCSNNPYFNLALEEYVMNNMSLDEEYFLLWQNEPTIVVGKYQNTLQEINEDFIKENSVHVVRRLSGGGAVYHDLGNLNFTFIVNNKDNKSLNFEFFTKPILEILKKMGVKAEFIGRNDLVINGKKFSGNSQYKTKERILHHGTLLFNSKLEDVVKALNVSKDKFLSKSVKSVKSRVTNIIDHLNKDITVEEFKEFLLKEMKEYRNIKEYKLTENDVENIQKLVEDKYNTWEWNFGKSPSFNVKIDKRFKAGKVESRIYVEKGIIKNIKFYGDFFGSGKISYVENKLVNQKYKKDDILKVLNSINLNYYFSNILPQELISCIIE